MIVILRTADAAARTSQTWIRPGQRLTVGRTYGDVLVPNDPAVSRSHFEVSCQADGAWLRDLGSTSGTFLNGQQVVKSQLRHGDQIVAGQTKFTVEISGEAASQADQPRQIIPAAGPAAPVPAGSRRKGLEVVNATPFAVGRLFARVRYPAHSMTVLVKGTFTLKPQGAVKIADEQLPLSGDIPYPDDADGHNAPRYPSDMAPFKPRADLLLVGHCHAPAGQYAGQVLASFKVGGRGRTLRVSGKRYWQGVLATKPSDPRPFQKQALRYEFAFGGALSPANPLGKGAIRVKDTMGAMRIPTPEIEDAARPMTKATDRPPPAGFGPIRWDWAPRRQRMGTYGAKWLAERWPHYPADLDWRHFNVAPDELQLEGYLRGDEPVHLTNLHPGVAAYHTALPGLKVRAFVEHWDGAFVEHTLHLDTLWVDADREQLVLIWRGVVPVQGDEAPELRRLFVLAEPLHTPRHDCRSYYQQVLLEKELVEPPSEPSPEVAVEAGPTEEELLARRRAAEAEVAQAIAEMRAQLAAAGLDPENLPPGVKERVDKVLAAVSGAEPRVTPWTRETVAAHAAQKGSFAGERLSGLDLSRLDFSGLDLKGAEIIGANLSGACLVQANLKGAQLIGSTLEDADLGGASLAEAYLVTARLTNARLVEADLAGAVLSGANVRGADLTRAKLPQADLNAANLAQANLAGANLSQARLGASNLSEANLTGAMAAEVQAAAINLTSARLVAANFEKANLTGALLAGANLEDAEFGGANLSRVDARQVRAVRADLSRAQLTEADFRGAALAGANLMAAQAPDCKFAQADLTDAKLGLAADFTRGDFREVTAPRSVWTAASLAGAGFAGARLEEADFSETNCREATFQAANLRRAKFRKAQLAAANLRQANLFETAFLKADLTGADASEANLFGAGFMEAQTAGLKTEGANIQRTLLAMQR